MQQPLFLTVSNSDDHLKILSSASSTIQTETGWNPDDDHVSQTTDKDMRIKSCDSNIAVKVERTLLCARPCT